MCTSRRTVRYGHVSCQVCWWIRPSQEGRELNGRGRLNTCKKYLKKHNNNTALDTQSKHRHMTTQHFNKCGKDRKQYSQHSDYPTYTKHTHSHILSVSHMVTRSNISTRGEDSRVNNVNQTTLTHTEKGCLWHKEEGDDLSPVLIP